MGIFRFLFCKKNDDTPRARSASRAGRSGTDGDALHWQQSEGHLEWLSQFLAPQRSFEYATQDYWKRVLNESPHQVLDRRIAEGVLVPASVEDKLSLTLWASEVKDLLRQRGLPVSGRKEVGIARLVAADPGGMAALVADVKAYACSPGAREIVARYVTSKNERRQSAEDRAIEQVRKRDFRGASLTVANFESKEIFPRGINMNWSNYDPRQDEATLTAIFERRPKILAGLAEVDWEPLRVGAAMMHLWGSSRASKWLPENVAGLERFDNDTAARMILFNAHHLAEIADYRREGIKRVKVLGCEDSCSACRKIAGRRYGIDSVPELPYERCTHEMGCRCEALALP